jgi:hypothetical protein
VRTDMTKLVVAFRNVTNAASTWPSKDGIPVDTVAQCCLFVAYSQYKSITKCRRLLYQLAAQPEYECVQRRGTGVI